jgi:hypothetical protein
MAHSATKAGTVPIVKLKLDHYQFAERGASEDRLRDARFATLLQAFFLGD